MFRSGSVLPGVGGAPPTREPLVGSEPERE
jgi:hypothetical protein